MNIPLDELQKKNLATIIGWAWQNEIEVLFFTRTEVNHTVRGMEEKRPVIRFSKDGKTIQRNFANMDHVEGFMKNEWRTIGADLMIAPLEMDL